MVDSANAFRDRPAGQLRFTVPPGVETYLIGPVLARFLTQYPEIVIEISVDASMTDIVAGRYDAGIRFGKRIARDNTTSIQRRSSLLSLPANSELIA